MSNFLDILPKSKIVRILKKNPAIDRQYGDIETFVSDLMLKFIFLAKDEDFPIEEDLQEVKDYRIKSLKVSNFKLYPDKVNKIPYGINFSLKNAVILGANGTGKTSLTEGLDYVFTGNSDPFYKKEFLQFRKNVDSDEEPFFEVDTVSGKLTLDSTLNCKADFLFNSDANDRMSYYLSPNDDYEKKAFIYFISSAFKVYDILRLYEKILKTNEYVKDKTLPVPELKAELSIVQKDLEDFLNEKLFEPFKKVKDLSLDFLKSFDIKDVHFEIYNDRMESFILKNGKKIPPNKFLNKHDLYLYNLSLFTALRIVHNSTEKKNFPLIILEPFLYADYENRNRFALFFKKLLELNEPLQIIIFTSDGLIFRSCADAAYYLNKKDTINFNKIFVPTDLDDKETLDDDKNKFWNLVRRAID